MPEPKACPHIGELHPNRFQCMDCEDTADKCNCNDCHTVWCDECNDMVWVPDTHGKLNLVNCYDVKEAWEERQGRLDAEKKDCTSYDFCKKYSRPNEDLHCDDCGHYQTTGDL